ncbi:MAG: hypothetical protein JW395_2418 [Nitrospira sp.]|nr:hypothetical protein [Nitrospira sp.]
MQQVSLATLQHGTIRGQQRTLKGLSEVLTAQPRDRAALQNHVDDRNSRSAGQVEQHAVRLNDSLTCRSRKWHCRDGRIEMTTMEVDA